MPTIAPRRDTRLIAAVIAAGLLVVTMISVTRLSSGDIAQETPNMAQQLDRSDGIMQSAEILEDNLGEVEELQDKTNEARTEALELQLDLESAQENGPGDFFRPPALAAAPPLAKSAAVVKSDCKKVCDEALHNFKCSNVYFVMSASSPGPSARYRDFLTKCRMGCDRPGEESTRTEAVVRSDCFSSAQLFLREEMHQSSGYCHGSGCMKAGGRLQSAQQRSRGITCKGPTSGGSGNWHIDAWVAGCVYVKKTAYMPITPSPTHAPSTRPPTRMPTKWTPTRMPNAECTAETPKAEKPKAEAPTKNVARKVATGACRTGGQPWRCWCREYREAGWSAVASKCREMKRQKISCRHLRWLCGWPKYMECEHKNRRRNWAIESEVQKCLAEIVKGWGGPARIHGYDVNYYC